MRKPPNNQKHKIRRERIAFYKQLPTNRQIDRIMDYTSANQIDLRAIRQIFRLPEPYIPLERPNPAQIIFNPRP